MKQFIITVAVILLYSVSIGQVSIGSKIPDPSAILEVKSNNKGMLIPRMSASERTAILRPATGLLVFQTDGNSGFNYYSGTEWRFLPPAASTLGGIATDATTVTNVTSVTGTTNRITSTGGTAPKIDIATNYIGQNSITTLGTIASGSWNATVIPSTKGGAGAVSGILKANGAGVVSAAVKGTDFAAPISLTTTGSTGAASYNATTGVLNIPIYAGGTGASYTFSSPLSLSGTTVSLPVAGAVSDGYLSSADWNVFHAKLSTNVAASTYALINAPVFTGNVGGITKAMVGLGNVDNTNDLGKPISTAVQAALDLKLPLNATTSAIAEGEKLYFPGDRVRTTSLTGYVLKEAADLTEADDVVTAFGKLQGQIKSHSASTNSWSLFGNSNTDPTTHFIGTTDEKDLVFKVGNIPSGRIDYKNLNISLGKNSFFQNTTGTNNIAFGENALLNNFVGSNNIALGLNAMLENKSGSGSIAIGYNSLKNNLGLPGAEGNVAIGWNSMQSLLVARGNTAVGAILLSDMKLVLQI